MNIQSILCVVFSWILGNSFLIESVTSTKVGKCKDDTASFVNARRCRFEPWQSKTVWPQLSKERRTKQICLHALFWQWWAVFWLFLSVAVYLSRKSAPSTCVVVMGFKPQRFLPHRTPLFPLRRVECLQRTSCWRPRVLRIKTNMAAGSPPFLVLCFERRQKMMRLSRLCCWFHVKSRCWCCSCYSAVFKAAAVCDRWCCSCSSAVVTAAVWVGRLFV